MKKFLLSILILNINLGMTQTKSEIDSLLNKMPDSIYSRTIGITDESKKIISYGKKSLPILNDFFTDSTLTKIKSKCQKKYITKGDVAIILADKIEPIPISTIIGFKNCNLTFCNEYDSLIEYYLSAIKDYGLENFRKKYITWLESDKRKEWGQSINIKTKRERKKEIKDCKRRKKKNTGR